MRADDLLDMSPRQRAKVRGVLEKDFRTFASWVFFLLEGRLLQWTAVQASIAMFLRAVEQGEVARGIVNTKPRFGKSVLFGLWCAWWLLKNPICKFFYLSCSDILAREQSDLVQSVLKLPEIQLLWGVEIRKDSKAKDLWKTVQGGYFRAVTTGGQVVGFGAGQLGFQGFAGALIIDDPLKPEDIPSILKMETMNTRYKRTIRHRVNDPRTPILVVMQRLHDNDLTGFLLGGASGEYWHHMRLPGVVEPDEEERAEARYESDWDHAIPFPTVAVEGYVWESKFGPQEDAAERLDEETWGAQTMQNPRVAGGSVFRISWFKRYDRFDVTSGVCGKVLRGGNWIDLRMLSVFADTAQKTEERHDFSVFQLWGLGLDGNIYLIDQLRGKWEAPELAAASEAWLSLYADTHPRKYGWREVHIEDKSSGTGLIQQLRLIWGARIIPVQRGVDKVSRAISVQLPMSEGRVYIPSDGVKSPWLGAYLSEFAAFSKLMNHPHDDQIDPTIDAINVMAKGGGQSIFDRVG